MEEKRPTRFTLERYVAGELSPPERNELEQALASDPQLKGQLEELKRDERAFRSEVPFDSFQNAHAERTTVRSQKSATKSLFAKRLWWPHFAVAIGAAAALLIFINTLPLDDGTVAQRDNSSTIRIKGAGVSLSAQILEPNRALRPAVAGETIEPGTQVQLVFDSGDASYMALIGIDPEGNVETYWPERGESFAKIPKEHKGTLPFALTIDATPGREEFIAVFATEPLSLAPILQVARSAAKPETNDARQLILPTNVSQASFWLNKR